MFPLRDTVNTMHNMRDICCACYLFNKYSIHISLECSVIIQLDGDE